MKMGPKQGFLCPHGAYMLVGENVNEGITAMSDSLQTEIKRDEGKGCSSVRSCRGALF